MIKTDIYSKLDRVKIKYSLQISTQTELFFVGNANHFFTALLAIYYQDRLLYMLSGVKCHLQVLQLSHAIKNVWT